MSDVAIVENLLSAEEARKLTCRIRQSLAVAWADMVVAYNGRAWLSLGYDHWDDYCAEEFDGQRIRLPREDRREVVSSLREAGLSIRAIAAATGVATNTIQSDLAAQVSQTDTPAAPVQGVDGKTYSPTSKPAGTVIDEHIDRRTTIGDGQPTSARPSNVDADGVIDDTSPNLDEGSAGEVIDLDKRRADPKKDWQNQDPAVQHDLYLGRCVKRLEMFCSSLHEFQALAASPDRDAILARLAPSDLAIILRAEREITWTTSPSTSSVG